MTERKKLCGWKAISDYMELGRILLIRYNFPVYDGKAPENRGYRVYAYTDELNAHREKVKHGTD